MRMTIDRTELAGYVARQMGAMFPDLAPAASGLDAPVNEALARLEHCFSHIRIKYFFDGEQAVFNHLNTDQYAMFLYLLSNTIHRRGGDPALAAKAYALNKALHGLDIYYEVELPAVFALQHPVGTVIGRGRYSDYLFIYQRVSVGANLANVYPTFGEGVVLFGGSAVIGDCRIGDNVWLSVGTTILDQSVPGGYTIFGRSPALTFKPTRRNVIRDMFQRA